MHVWSSSDVYLAQRVLRINLKGEQFLSRASETREDRLTFHHAANLRRAQIYFRPRRPPPRITVVPNARETGAN